MTEERQPRTLAEAKREIARLRQQNHDHAAKRDRELAYLNSVVAKNHNATKLARERMETLAVPWCKQAIHQGLREHWQLHASVNSQQEVITAFHDGLTINRPDPLRHKLRFLRYHWRCVLTDILAGDLEGLRIDYLVHMVRYTNAELARRDR